MTVEVMLFQKVVEAITWLVMSAQGIRFGVEWHAHHMYVTPDLVLPFFIFIQSFYSTNTEHQLCAWPEKISPCPRGAFVKGIYPNNNWFSEVA